jgi:hypothetical protein
MDSVRRLARISSFAMAAGVTACGRTVVPASEAPGPVVACPVAARPAGVITIAEPAGSASPANPLPPALLIEIAVALPLCGARKRDSDDTALTASRDTVVVRPVGEADARDLIDQGPDVLVTRDRAVAAYALGRPGLAVVPLAWDRTYMLVIRRLPAMQDSELTPLRAALAAEAIRADARPFPPRDGLLRGLACGADTARPTAGDGIQFAGERRNRDTRRVVYDESDSTARFLAERVAVLASTRSTLLAGVAAAINPGGSEMPATGVSSSDVSRALDDSNSAAYVVAISPDTSLRCTESRPHFADSPPLPVGIVPLIQTRPAAIVRLDAVARIAAASAGAVVAGGHAP